MKINTNGRVYVRWIEKPVHIRFIQNHRILESGRTSVKKFIFCFFCRIKPRAAELESLCRFSFGREESPLGKRVG